MTTELLATKEDITLHAGNDVSFTVTVTGSDTVAVWLDDWTSIFIISRDLDRATWVELLRLTSEDDEILHYPDTDAINVLQVNIAADDTRAFDGNPYNYELKVISPTEQEFTALYGRMTFASTADRTVTP